MRTLPQLNPATGDNFGISVAVGESFLVGASHVGPGTFTFGAAYVFQGAADFDGDGDTDGADFLIQQRNYGKSSDVLLSHGDAVRDGVVDTADLAEWEDQYGSQYGGIVSELQSITVPEPLTIILFFCFICSSAFVRPGWNCGSR